MKILLCQTSPKVGALEENVCTIQKYYTQAQRDNVDICVFPELSTTGYLSEDLFLNPGFIRDVGQHVDRLIKNTGKTCLLLSTPILKSNLLYNGVIAAQDGIIIGQTYKQELVNYGIFDEPRYFTPGEPQIIRINGVRVGVPICEDIWSDSVCNKLQNKGAKIFISLNASPFEKGKMVKRVQKVKEIFNKTKIPTIYCNQVTAQDGIIFDGRSFCFDGELNIVGKSFQTSNQIIEFKDNKFHTDITYSPLINRNEEIYQAIILGLKYYVRENNFTKVILGLSGGIDSAIVAAIAVDALGSENVSAFMLPSKFTSEDSMNDAQKIADSLKIPLTTIRINDAVDCLAKIINRDCHINETSIMHQNLQSRIRGTILMAESNKTNALLLTTGNKSEYATGYATIYGDMNGGFNPIKDLYKTELYELALYKRIIPPSVLKKPPTAELAPNQRDSDTLPEYTILDQILNQHIEHNKNREELSKNFSPDIVDKVLKLVKKSEFKRRQSAPGIKISIKNFEKDRRFPITNHYG